jgi:hypothetical protein
MAEQPRRDWLEESSRHDMTWICERALRAAAGITWQHLGGIASGRAGAVGRDYYHPARSVIAEYLRHTGRMQEAAEVEAIGCNEPPPHTGFAALTEATLAEMRRAMRGH